MRLFLLLLQSLIGFSISEYSDDLRIHQANLAKLKCNSLPFRSFYDGMQCYFAVPFGQGTELCHSAPFGAVMDTTETSRSALKALFLEPSNYHNEFSVGQNKSVLCRYDSPSTCNNDELRGMPGKCVRRLNETMNLEMARQRCTSLGNYRLATIRNDDENRAFASLIPANERAWIDHTWFGKKSGSGAAEKIPYFRWFLGVTMEPKISCHNYDSITINALKRSYGPRFGYWIQTPMQMKWSVLCIRHSDGHFTPVEEKPVQEQTTSTTSKTPVTTTIECRIEKIPEDMMKRISAKLLYYTENLAIRADETFKLIKPNRIDEVKLQCACGPKHLRYVVLSLTPTVANVAVQNVAPPTISPRPMYYGVMAEKDACGATMPVYGDAVKGFFLYSAASVKSGMVPNGRRSSDAPMFYAWP